MQCFSGVFKVADIYLKAPTGFFFFLAARRVMSAEGASYLGRPENRKQIEHLKTLFPVESVSQARLEFTPILINNE